jgi:hypothetical protein
MLAPKMEAACSCIMAAYNQKTTWCNNSEDHYLNINFHFHGNTHTSTVFFKHNPAQEGITPGSTYVKS